ncbi:EamA family transporter [Leuconostoc falkenbergense]|uniref:EamA family transporter n=1 Tax=Leuconostoc falkenbergense TaxID=2766470 RepID=UPI0024AC94DD|nr:EamA family transporter [Leuconostoc falkenbergense]MDI6667542.1 EamA family transporter [Leuconostoc falkenbergense]
MTSFKSIICGIISATLFGISGILASILFRQAAVAPEWLVGVRMLCAGAVLLCVLTLFTKEAVFSVWQHTYTALLVVLFGLFGVLLAQSSFFLSVYYGDAATATVLQSLGPAIIVVLMSIYSKRWPSRLEFVAIILALLGVFLLVTNGDITHLKINPRALYWGVISAFGLVGYTLIPKPLLHQTPPLVIVGWGLLIGGLVANLIHPVWRIASGVDLQDIWIVIAIIIFGTLIPYALYVMSLAGLKPSSASLLGTIEPLVATTLSVTLLGTRLRGFQLIGILLILSTILLISLPLKKIFTNRIITRG